MIKITKKIKEFLLSLKLARFYLHFVNWMFFIVETIFNNLENFIKIKVLKIKSTERLKRKVWENESFTECFKENNKNVFQCMVMQLIFDDAEFDECNKISKSIVEKVLKYFKFSEKQMLTISRLLTLIFICIALLSFGFIFSILLKLLWLIVNHLVNYLVNNLDKIYLLIYGIETLKLKKIITIQALYFLIFLTITTIIFFIIYNTIKKLKN
ncbi:MAG: hypothetical protein IJ086_15895 [Clostridium sp.]|nr:hypothetical protein [Clostridium sp.]MBQ9000157.1 hypothetical protein [Clostridium sp.]